MRFVPIALHALVIVVAVPLSAAGARQATVAPAPPTGTAAASADTGGQSWRYQTADARFRVEIVSRGLSVPWAFAFLPDGRALVSERPVGRLTLLDVRTGATTPVEGTPVVFGKVDGGMLDVVLHPDYARNGWIYFAYAAAVGGGNTTVVERARLTANRLVDRERLFTAFPAVPNGSHFGTRLALRDGYLFVSLGDRDIRGLAQGVETHHGKIVRLHDDGRVPGDNPFAARAGARAEIWSIGHRNPQGLAFHPHTGALWSHEHGPKGGDEVNVVVPGRDYGWPTITYGEEYSGGAVGDGLTRRDGMEQPLHYYVPSIAPSDMLFYTGSAFPAWRGNLFIGALALKHLNRLVLDGTRVVREERLLEDRGWRIRAVEQGPDGFLYLGVDSGLVVRLRPE